MTKNHPPSRRPAKKTLYIDAAWVTLLLLALLTVWLAYMIWYEDWLWMVVVLPVWVFLVWVSVRGRVFSPWAYRIRRAQAARRDGQWQVVDRQVERAMQWADRFGATDYRRGLLLFLIGDIKRDRGQYEEAERLYAEALPIFREQGKPCPFEMLAVCTNLGVCYYTRGRFDVAKEYYEQALQAAAELKPAQQWMKVAALHNLARLHLDHGEWDDARELLHEAEARLAHTKKTAAFNAIVYMSWSELALREGDLANADHFATEALAQADKVPLDGKIIQAIALAALAEVHWRMRRYEEAEDCAADALELMQSVSDGEHPYWSRPYFLLALTAIADGNDSRAEKLFRKGLHVREIHGFPDTFGTVEYLQSFAALLRRTGRPEEADLFDRRTQQALNRAAGPPVLDKR